MRANGSPMKIKPQAAADRPSNRSATPSATWPKPTPHAAANATSDEWVHRILRRITKPPATVELRKAAVITLSSLHQVPGKTPIRHTRGAQSAQRFSRRGAANSADLASRIRNPTRRRVTMVGTHRAHTSSSGPAFGPPKNPTTTDHFLPQRAPTWRHPERRPISPTVRVHLFSTHLAIFS